jgi:nucleotide-binding universal stress UspA family protein
MLSLKKILVPTDFSQQAEYAFQAALQLGRIHDVEIQLVHVVDHSVGYLFTGHPIEQMTSPSQPDYLESWNQINEEAERRLQEQVSRQDIQSYSLSYKVVWGNPYKGIAQQALEEQADLVVMGSKGASGMEELLIGSNAERMIRNAPVPVLVVKNPPTLDQAHRLGFLSDLEAEEDTVLQNVLGLQALLNAELHIARINTPHHFLSDQRVEEKLHALLEGHQMPGGYRFHHYSDHYQHEGIQHFVESYQIDIIAMGTHGRKGMSHFLLGSLAEDIVNASTVPVFTVRIETKK